MVRASLASPPGAYTVFSDDALRAGWLRQRRGLPVQQGPHGPAVHDDLVKRDFSARAANELWLTDITEHKTAEGKLYLCAIKDVYSNRIVGYSIDSTMKSRIAVNALDSAVARRGGGAIGGGADLDGDAVTEAARGDELDEARVPVRAARAGRTRRELDRELLAADVPRGLCARGAWRGGVSWRRRRG